MGGWTLEQDALTMLPQHRQNVTASLHVVDKSAERGFGVRALKGSPKVGCLERVGPAESVLRPLKASLVKGSRSAGFWLGRWRREALLECV